MILSPSTVQGIVSRFSELTNRSMMKPSTNRSNAKNE